MHTLIRELLSELRGTADGGDPDGAMFVESLNAATALRILPLERIITGTEAPTQEKLDATTHWLYEGFWQSSRNQLVRTLSSHLHLALLQPLRDAEKVSSK